MAIKMTEQRKKDLTKVKIIAKIDDSIDWDSEDTDWEAYSDTLNESNLAFKPNCQPTRFVCNFELKEKDARAIKNYLLTGKDTEGRPTFAFGDWSSEVARRCLKAIEEPEGMSPMDKIPFETDRDGYLNKKTMGILQRVGVIEEIFAQYGRLTSNDERKETKNS